MKIAIAGSRSLNVDIPEGIIPETVSAIYSGGAVGIDIAARRYAARHNILIIEILPEYDLYGRTAPLKRNDVIINQVDEVYLFWDGKSRGTAYVISRCKELNKPYHLYKYTDNAFYKIS